MSDIRKTAVVLSQHAGLLCGAATLYRIMAFKAGCMPVGMTSFEYLALGIVTASVAVTMYALHNLSFLNYSTKIEIHHVLHKQTKMDTICAIAPTVARYAGVLCGFALLYKAIMMTETGLPISGMTRIEYIILGVSIASSAPVVRAAER